MYVSYPCKFRRFYTNANNRKKPEFIGFSGFLNSRLDFSTITASPINKGKIAVFVSCV